MLTNFRIAALLFFAWLLLDSLASVLLASPMEGIFYPAASGTLKSSAGDWSNKPRFGAPMYLAIFASIWIFLVRREGSIKGLRVAALITAFAMVPFWVVSAVSADLYQLEINRYWLVSMIYANISFLLFAFIGRGMPGDLDF